MHSTKSASLNWPHFRCSYDDDVGFKKRCEEERVIHRSLGILDFTSWLAYPAQTRAGFR